MFFLLLLILLHPLPSQAQKTAECSRLLSPTPTFLTRLQHHIIPSATALRSPAPRASASSSLFHSSLSDLLAQTLNKQDLLFKDVESPSELRWRKYALAKLIDEGLDHLSQDTISPQWFTFYAIRLAALFSLPYDFDVELSGLSSSLTAGLEGQRELGRLVLFPDVFEQVFQSHRISLLGGRRSSVIFVYQLKTQFPHRIFLPTGRDRIGVRSINLADRHGISLLSWNLEAVKLHGYRMSPLQALLHDSLHYSNQLEALTEYPEIEKNWPTIQAVCIDAIEAEQNSKVRYAAHVAWFYLVHETGDFKTLERVIQGKFDFDTLENSKILTQFASALEDSTGLGRAILQHEDEKTFSKRAFQSLISILTR